MDLRGYVVLQAKFGTKKIASGDYLWYSLRLFTKAKYLNLLQAGSIFGAAHLSLGFLGLLMKQNGGCR